jgi:cysteinyl-tRNA synthetase
MVLKLTNTLGGKKAAFQSLEPGKVRMYHCGPTVSAHLNVAKFRSFLLADLLRRHFKYSGYEVVQVMNITDVGHLNEFEEDAVEIAAGRTGLTGPELVEMEEKIFHADRRALHICDATCYPRAREHIAEMIAVIADLEKRGFTYEAGGNIYFDITQSPRFGRLAGKALPELEKLAGIPEGDHPEKRNSLDIDLWRKDTLHQVHWPSPWGRGFPGWHVECVAMSHKYLEGSFDIHTGTCENVFPHHECEIAQAEALTGKPLASCWLHTGPVTVEGLPMTRENKNLMTARQMLDAGFRGSVIRVALLAKHYREPLDFGEAAMDAARPLVNNYLAFHEHLISAASKPVSAGGSKEAPAPWIEETDKAFQAALDDDLDYPTALGAILNRIETLQPQKVGNPNQAREALLRWDRVIGILS